MPDMADVDLTAVKSFLAWEKPQSMHATRALQYLIACIVAIEKADERVGSLAAHWRAIAGATENVDEREAFRLCADQLDQARAETFV